MLAEARDWNQAADEYLLAGRDDTSRSKIRLLSVSPFKRIRQRVAENTAAPRAVLRALGKDDNADVRIAISHNPRTPAVILSSLARDKDPDVRLAMAENPHLPLYVLSILSADENPYVSHRATKTINDAQAEGLKRLKAAFMNRMKIDVVELPTEVQSFRIAR